MLLGVTVIIYAIIRLQPGNPFLYMIDVNTDPSFLPEQLEKIGYNDPLLIQYGKWLLRALHGDLGYSIEYKQPVIGLIVGRFRNTLILASASFLISTILSISIGILSAMYPHSFIDRFVTLCCFIGVSIPVFFFGLLLIKYFAYDHAIFPVSGIQSLGMHYTGWKNVADTAKHLVLPAMTSALTQTATLLRYMRSSVLSTVSQDYISMAMAKGMTRRQAILKHGVRNAVLPVVTVICNRIPDLLSGALIVETVFVWPGIGLLNYNAILHQDYPMIMGIALFVAVIVILCNLMADILYALLDPRIKW